MRVLAIIPARYASTRFPAKPLAVLGRKCIIEWVYSAARSVFDRVVVATDDSRIAAAVEAFGGEVVMTSASHRCGTERCAEAAAKLGGSYDVVVNIQGDEPFVSSEQLCTLISVMEHSNVDIATLATPITSGGETLFNGSQNHHFLGDVSNWLMRYPGGINVLDSKHVKIRPHFLENLSDTHAAHKLPAGEVRVCWKRQGRDILLEVTCPEEVSCDIELADSWILKDAGRNYCEKAKNGVYMCVKR